jgi:hypothetical protein
MHSDSAAFRHAFGLRLWLVRLLLPKGHAVWTWGLNDGDDADEPVFAKAAKR